MKTGKGWLWKVGIGLFALALVGFSANAGVISAGYYDSFGIKADNSLWGWGYDGSHFNNWTDAAQTQTVTVAYAQLGLGPTNTMVVMNGEFGVASPTQSGTAKTWLDVVGGMSRGFGIQSDGSLWGWGHDGAPVATEIAVKYVSIYHYEQNGALGMGAQLCQTMTGAYTNIAGPTTNDLYPPYRYVTTTTRVYSNSVMNGLTTNHPTQIGTNTSWEQVAVGGGFGLGLQSDGSIWSWGADGESRTYKYNTNGFTKITTCQGLGQLGQGDRVVSSTNYGGGDTYSVFSLIYTNDAATNYYLVLTATNTYTNAVTTNFVQYALYLNTPTKITAPTSMVCVAAGSAQGVAIGADGSLWTWGKNQSSYVISVCVTSGLPVYACTNGSDLGLGDTTLFATNVPVRIGSETAWASVSAGLLDTFTMAIKKDGSLWGWGNNNAQYSFSWVDQSQTTYVFRTYARGCLGLGSNTLFVNTPTRVGTDNNWSMVSAGHWFSLGLKTDGSIYAWGYNGSGNLGIGRSINYVAEPTRIGTDNDWVFISAGDSHSLAMKSDGSLWGWGNNTYASLGDQTGNAYEPVKISSGWGYSSPVIAAELNGGGDYDGDHCTDFVVYDASTGNWLVRLSSSGYALYSLPGLLGGPSYKLVTADFDGDGKTDPAVYQESSGIWLVKLSGSGYAQETTVFGGSGYTAVPADYDGDAKADYAVYNKTLGEWRIYMSGSAYTILKTGMWTGCVPVPMDYDGDMIAELALYESATGNWQIMLGDTVVSLPAFLGGANYLAVPMDYDGDRKADPAVYEESTGVWKIKLSSVGYWTLDSSLYGWSLGGTGYMPTPADYDGDRLADPTVYGLTSGYWFIMASSYGYITIVPVW